MILAVKKDQHTHDLIESGGVFSLDFLVTSQGGLARKLAQTLAPEDCAVGGSPYTPGEATGAPLFEEAFANLERWVTGSMEAGDHTVHLGEIVATSLRRPAGLLTTSTPQ